MPYCEECGSEVSSEARFCKKCGTAVIIDPTESNLEASNTFSTKPEEVAGEQVAGREILSPKRSNGQEQKNADKLKKGVIVFVVVFGIFMLVKLSGWGSGLVDSAGPISSRQNQNKSMVARPELKQMKTLSMQSPITSNMVFGNDGKSLIVGSGLKLSVWDTKEGIRTREYDMTYRDPDGIVNLASSSDGKKIAVSMGKSGPTNFLDLSTNSHSTINVGMLSHYAVAFNNQKNGTLSIGGFNELVLYDYSTAKKISTFPIAVYPNQRIRQIQNGERFIFVGISEWERPAYLSRFDIYDDYSKLIYRYDQPSGGKITRATFSPDGSTIAFGTPNGILLYDTKEKRINTIEGSGETISIAYSPSGKYLAVAYKLGTIEIWDTVALKSIYTKECGVNGQIIYSPQGDSLAAMSTGNVVRIWDASSFN